MKYWGGNWDVSFLWHTKMAKMTCVIIIITMKMSVFKTEIAAGKYVPITYVVIIIIICKKKSGILVNKTPPISAFPV